MKITRQGVWFKYHNDEMLRRWPWAGNKVLRFYSKNYNKEFPSLRDYWREVGVVEEAARKRKVKGFTEEDMILEWAESKFRNDIVIILRNINVQIKSTTFWISVPPQVRSELLHDVVVFFFPDVDSARKVYLSIEPEFAESFLFDKGELISLSNSYARLT